MKRPNPWGEKSIPNRNRRFHESCVAATRVAFAAELYVLKLKFVAIYDLPQDVKEVAVDFNDDVNFSDCCNADEANACTSCNPMGHVLPIVQPITIRHFSAVVPFSAQYSFGSRIGLGSSP